MALLLTAMAVAGDLIVKHDLAYRAWELRQVLKGLT